MQIAENIQRIVENGKISKTANFKIMKRFEFKIIKKVSNRFGIFTTSYQIVGSSIVLKQKNMLGR